MMRFHPLFYTFYSSWKEIESKIETLPSNKEKGDAFEQFVFFYFKYFQDIYQIKSIYAEVFENLKIPKPIKERLKLEKFDHGVDGVYFSRDGNLVAYQAKFRTGRHSATATELSTFWAESEYADFRCIIANSSRLPSVSLKKRNHLSVLVDKFDGLDRDFFEALFSFVQQGSEIQRSKKNPFDFQQRIISEILNGLKIHDRGKLVAACGAGKTLVSLWIHEGMNSTKTLFLAPSLLLVRQTLEEWTKNSNFPFTYLSVCSDKTIQKNIEIDDFDLDLSEFDVPVTTDKDDVLLFLNKRKGNKVIFSTYQSLDVIRDAIKESGGFFFDLIIFDEAHRTAGIKRAGLFGLGLDNQEIPSNKRLFMTATERLVKPWIQDRGMLFGKTIFSMDDEEVYGPVFSRLSFGEAIGKGIISDYRIVISGVLESGIKDYIQSNRYLSVAAEDPVPYITTGQDLFKGTLLLKAMQQFKLNRLISFHSSVRKGINFTELLYELVNKSEGKRHVFENINGSQSSSERAEIIMEFERCEIGVLTNVRCLTEGVDLPYLDGIFFADPKNSLIDIVQATGRALRKPFGSNEKIAYIIIPIVVPDKETDIESINTPQFEALHNIIQALRDQDETLEEWINELNLFAITNRRGRGSRPPKGKVQYILPKEVKIESFDRALCLRIAKFNKEHKSYVSGASKLGKKERVSKYKRVFKTIGDYNPVPYKNSLIDPTIAKYISDDDILTRKELAFNNNNVSHTERLGLIYQYERNKFILSKIGRSYKKGGISFPQLFKNQMMLYGIKIGDSDIYPYRAAFSVLRKTKSLNYIEFLFGIYSIQAKPDMNQEIEEIINRVFEIRQKFPNVHLTSTANRPLVEGSLDQLCPVNFSSKDIWTDRTTTGNQYRYFLNHLSLFDDVFAIDFSKKVLILKEDSDQLIQNLLKESTPKDGKFLNHYGFWCWIDLSHRGRNEEIGE